MSKAVYTPDQIIDLLTRSGLHWAEQTVTFGFPIQDGVDAVQQEFVIEAMKLWDDVANIDLVYSGGSFGDIVFYNNVGEGTYTSYGVTPAGQLRSVFITLDQTWPSNNSDKLAYGSYGFESILHEIGHAIGLSHPGYYKEFANYQDDAVFAQDTRRYTVMSYFYADEDGSGTSWFFYNGSYWQWYEPQTPMIYDILSIEAYYGRETDTRRGDTIYGYHSTADSNVLDFEVNPAPVLTIFDSGGTDTLDLSGDSVEVYYHEIDDYTRVIDLNDGAYSSTHGMTNNIGVAFGTIIENVVGTQFDDYIIGNEYANMVDGGGGSDGITGGAGDDIARGRSGDDLIGGDDGNDVIFGGIGQDWTSGDAGDDVLFVVVGENGLIFDSNDGADTVVGYKPGSDEFDLTAVSGLRSFDDLSLTISGHDVIVDYGSGYFILKNTSLSSVEEGDFLV